MLPSVVSRLFILVFGTLYPAYTSYKAVRNKDPREYVKCMMYWIVFALYCTVETFTDVFLSFWFPFYHELKILILLWLMSPTTRGSTYLYTKLVHPTLTSREQEIDEAIAMAKRQGYTTVMKLGSRGVNYATNVIMQTALKGDVEILRFQDYCKPEPNHYLSELLFISLGGGGLVNHLKKSYSYGDLVVGDIPRSDSGVMLSRVDEEGRNLTDSDVDNWRYERAYVVRRSDSEHLDLYFREIDSMQSPRHRKPLYSCAQSSEDVSSGYSSSDVLVGGRINSLHRSTSISSASMRNLGARQHNTPVDIGQSSISKTTIGNRRTRSVHCVPRVQRRQEERLSHFT